MDNAFLAQYFGPLEKKNCFYFFFFSMVGFLFMFLCLLMVVTSVAYNYKKIMSKDGILTFIHIIVSFINLFVSSFLLYFSNRLLNTMCMKVL